MKTWTLLLILLLLSLNHVSGAPWDDQAVDSTSYGIIRESHGEGDGKYWIFRPSRPGRYPVVVFIHGWAATEPLFYMAWIRHLVGRGNIVVYPRYQNLLDTGSENFTDNSAEALKDALMRIGNEYSGELFLIGHSAGGIIAVNLASRDDLPEPGAVLVVQPGVSEEGRKFENLTGIPPGTLLVVMAGDDDNITGTRDSYLIMEETPQIPSERKMFLLVRSDGPLRADHLSPLAVSDEFGVLVDNLDYSGYWKVLDILIELGGENRTLMDVDMERIQDMGNWSDGRPVQRMILLYRPGVGWMI